MIGETLGRYRVISRIGEGGMGVVYLAEHALIGRRAAVKVLRPELSQKRDYVTRFFNEARAVAAIRHPGLVDIFDYGHGPGGSAYIVMELLDGESLAQLIARERKLAVATAFAIARQVAAALGAAHAQSIVHRDLKPANLFLVPDANAPGGLRVKVLDFGVAKLTAVQSGVDTAGTNTAHGAFFGTPRYMAPEQCKNASDVDGRADVYSLGCIVFEMLLGRAPYVHGSWAELIAAHIHETPPRARAIDPAVPADIDALIAKALAKSIDERYATMAELGAAIDAVWTRAVGDAEAQRYAPVVALGDAADRPVKPTQSLTGEVARRDERPRRAGWLVAIGVALAGTAIAFAVENRDGGDEPTPGDVALRPQITPLPAGSPPAAPPAVASLASEVEPTRAPSPAVTVTLLVDSSPRGAAVYRASDGVRLGATPLERTFERTDGVADFVIKLPGYVDKRVSLATSEDGKTVAKLVRAPAPARARPARPAVPPSTVLDPYGGK